jgi:glycosyltransferase involved in cell wall biosynthesis
VTDASTITASVVIAVHGDQRARRAVAALVTQSADATSYEVIVAENGSSDLADLDGAHGIVRYLHTPEANSAAARNAGLWSARGRYLLLTDADCVPHPQWVEQMTLALAASGVGAVGGHIIKHTPRTWVQRHAITIVDGQHEPSYLPALHLPYVAGANAGFVTELLRGVGGFDEDLKSGNDVDACYKIGLLGQRVIVSDGPIVEHEDRASLRSHFVRFHRYATYQVLLFRKYRHLSGRRFVVDTYPLTRAVTAAAMAPTAVLHLIGGDPALLSRIALQLIEAAGVLCGDLTGALRYRQLYL